MASNLTLRRAIADRLATPALLELFFVQRHLVAVLVATALHRGLGNKRARLLEDGVALAWRLSHLVFGHLRNDVLRNSQHLQISGCGVELQLLAKRGVAEQFAEQAHKVDDDNALRTEGERADEGAQADAGLGNRQLAKEVIAIGVQQRANETREVGQRGLMLGRKQFDR